MAEEKKDVVDVEVVDEKKDDAEKKETKGEKKPGFFSKLKKSLDDSMLESNIQSAWNDDHQKWEAFVYGGSLFSGSTFHGSLNGKTLTYYARNDEKGLAEHTLLLDSKDNKAYWVVSSKKVDLTIYYDGTDYTRSGYEVALDDEVTEVKVVKAGDKYYLYKFEK